MGEDLRPAADAPVSYVVFNLLLSESLWWETVESCVAGVFGRYLVYIYMHFVYDAAQAKNADSRRKALRPATAHNA